ncbi:hypothetical protein [Xanthomonas sp. GPE 39]|uniref:hypothetical protein n=1 Tax=Xanthomonas sp. GPE 39 TaxID=1583099 RepID=UPI0005F2A89D|nr:hypothetical protein [Xanthomonas sp. GPE 39]
MKSRKSPPRMQVSEQVQGLLKLATTALPVLYLSGRMFADAYWSALGMGALPLSYASDDYIYMGLLALTWSAASLFGMNHEQWRGVVLLGGIGLGITALLGWSVFGALRDWLRVRAQVRMAGISPDNAWRVSEAMVLAFVMVVALLVLTALAARQEGTRHANQRLRRLTMEANVGSAVGRVEEKVADKVVVLDCNGRWCVVWQPGGPVALPVDKIVRVQARGHVADVASVHQKSD